MKKKLGDIKNEINRSYQLRANQSLVKLLYNTLQGDFEQGKETVFNEDRQIEWTTFIAESLSQQGYEVPKEVNDYGIS